LKNGKKRKTKRTWEKKELMWFLFCPLRRALKKDLIASLSVEL
jgi:hypothetical protein